MEKEKVGKIVTDSDYGESLSVVTNTLYGKGESL